MINDTERVNCKFVVRKLEEGKYLHHCINEGCCKEDKITSAKTFYRMCSSNLETKDSALDKWIEEGTPVRTKEEVNSILTNLCKVCIPFFDERTQSCRLCGCSCNNNKRFLTKIKWATEECPIGKWERKPPMSFKDLKRQYENSTLTFVYPYIANGAEGDELLYSVRSVEKYFLGKADIWIVGDRPWWWKRDDRFVSCPKRKGGARRDRAHKLDTIVNTKAIPETFVWMQDDIYFIKPLGVEFLSLAWTRAKAISREKLDSWEPTGFDQQKKHTWLELLKNGKGLEDFAAHLPRIYSKPNWVSLREKYNINGNPPLVDDLLYCNEFLTEDTPTIPIRNFQYRATESPSDEEFEALSSQAYFLNHIHTKFAGGIERNLARLFPSPSIWEDETAVKPKLSTLPTMVVVAGSGRSGTSCVAGILHKLGVSMGKKFHEADKNNEAGYYEAVKLRRFMFKSFQQDGTPNNTFKTRIEWFRDWSKQRKESKVVGCKFPYLCFVLPEMVRVWPDLRVIGTNRPNEEVKGSLKRANWYNERRAKPNLFTESRDIDVKALNLPYLPLDFDEVISNTEKVVDDIIRFCGINPTAEQRQAAINHVQPNLRHIKS